MSTPRWVVRAIFPCYGAAMSEQIMRDNLFAIAAAYGNATGLSLTTVSKRMHGNGDFFGKFAQGEISTGLDTYFTMVARFRAGWPRGAAWPRTRAVPKLSRTTPKLDANLPPRGAGGKFLGKKMPKRSRAR